MAKSTVIFVLNGLLNGERGYPALPVGGGDQPPLRDGWYVQPDRGTDPVGPYLDRDAANLVSAVVDELDESVAALESALGRFLRAAEEAEARGAAPRDIDDAVDGARRLLGEIEDAF